MASIPAAVVAEKVVVVVVVPGVVVGLDGVVALLVDPETPIDIVSEFSTGLGEGFC